MELEICYKDVNFKTFASFLRRNYEYNNFALLTVTFQQQFLYYRCVLTLQKAKRHVFYACVLSVVYESLVNNA